VARDLRDMLDGAAGTPPALPAIEMIRRRARPAVIRRRAAAAAAVVGLALAAVAVTADLGDAPYERGATAVHPGPSPTPRQLRPGQLEPGTYAGQVGHYSFRLTLPTDDWTVLADRDTWLALTYRQYVVHLQVWGSVVPDDSADGHATEATPPDIAGWLATNDRITATVSRPDEVGGVPATEVVIRVARPLDRPPAECVTTHCVVLARIAGVDELVHLDSGERARVLVLGDPGSQLVVTYRAPESEFAVLDQAARGLLAGLQLTPTS